MARRARKQDAHVPRPCRENDRIEEIIKAVEQEASLSAEERRYLRELLERANAADPDGSQKAHRQDR